MAARKPAKKIVRKTVKASAKKPAVKKAAAKPKKAVKAVKSTAKKKVAKVAKVAKAPAAPRHISVGSKAFTKSQFIATLCEQTGLSRKEVTQLLDTVSKIVDAHLSKNGPAVFSWPGLFKMKVVKKPATKARKGINPFTGEPTTFKAKPASRKVKILPLKNLKEMAA